MRVMVTGGAGYIGSVVAEELLQDGHEVVVYDNLQKGHRQAVVAPAEFVHADLVDTAKLQDTLSARGIEAVIHMAADSLVGESCEQPAKYYQNNVVAGLTLLEAMREIGVSRIVFSSTAAVYGNPAELYEERPESRAAREAMALQLKTLHAAFVPEKGRPTKRDRRDLERLKGRR